VRALQDEPDGKGALFQPPRPSETLSEDPEGADRLLSGELGPRGDPDSHPREARRRAVQASKVMRVSLKFLRDILSTSSKVIVRQQ